MKRYPKYKDSGVEWIGDIPEYWSIRKLKYVIEIVNGSTPKSGTSEYWNGDIVWITPNDLGGLNGNKISGSIKKITELGLNSCGTTLTSKGSIILSTRAPIGHIGITETKTCTNQGCKTVVPDFTKCNNIFIYYYLLSAKDNLQSLGQGATFIELSSQNLKSYKTTLPPTSEQQSIANYLEHKTHQIDTLIEKKQKQIDLLKEQRTAIINHAVTKGLNPNVKMKDSGIEWLGEIPAHWELKKLKYFSEIVNGSTPKTGISEYWNGEIMWLTPDDLGKLNGKRIYSSARKITEQGLNSCGTKLTPKNSVVLSTRAPIGHIGILDTSSCINQGCKTIVPNFETCDFIYVYYLLYAQKEELQSLGQGSTFIELASQKLKDFKVPFPPKSEQTVITNFLDQKTNELDILSEKHNNSLEFLKEYRTALISDAVTGKIDVRDEVPA